MTPTRTESFVPLISTPPQSAGGQKEFPVTVIAKAKAKSFQSIAGGVTPPMPGSAPRAAGCEPKVNLQRDGNRVTGIQIQCSCGQVMELSCVYDAAVPQFTAQPASTPQPAGDSGKNLPDLASTKPKVP